MARFIAILIAFTFVPSVAPAKDPATGSLTVTQVAATYLGSSAGGVCQMGAFWLRQGKLLAVVKRSTGGGLSSDPGSGLSFRLPTEYSDPAIVLIRPKDGAIIKSISLKNFAKTDHLAALDLNNVYEDVGDQGDSEQHLYVSAGKEFLKVNLYNDRVEQVERIPIEASKLKYHPPKESGAILVISLENGMVLSTKNGLTLEDSKGQIVSTEASYRYSWPAHSALSPDENYFYIVGYQGTVDIFRIEKPAPVATPTKASGWSWWWSR